MAFKTAVVEFLVCSLAHSHCVLANNNNPAFCLKWKSHAMSNAAAFKSFRREADVLSNNMAKKKTSVTNTKVENLIIKNNFNTPLALVVYQSIITNSPRYRAAWNFHGT